MTVVLYMVYVPEPNLNDVIVLNIITKVLNVYTETSEPFVQGGEICVKYRP